MVDYRLRIDSVFVALSDSTRRDILQRTLGTALTVNQIAADYDMSLAAVSKHLKVLEEAGLITKRKNGRFVFISAVPGGLNEAHDYITQFESAYIGGDEE